MPQEQVLQEILETVVFIRDHAASKDDLAAVDGRMGSLEGRMGSLEGRMGSLEGRMGSLEGRMGSLEGRMGSLEDHMASKDDLAVVKNEIMTHMDGFIVLNQKLDIELVALRAKYDRLADQLQRIAQHLHLKFEVG